MLSSGDGIDGGVRSLSRGYRSKKEQIPCSALFSEEFHGAGKHEVGVSGYICPKEGVPVSGDLFRIISRATSGTYGKPCLANASIRSFANTGSPVMTKKFGL